ncbi:MAG: GNAT family N-acetyltransferase [Bowdeniella nasicola]|nr:GNAT family N-acetyltransferase [Bowdeniella nasicola]
MITVTRIDTCEDIRAARAIRHEVFVLEQGVPLILEIDARDEDAIQVLMRADDTPIGTGRLLREAHHPQVVHLGRLAILPAWRGQGLGARLVAGLEAIARETLRGDVGEPLICELSAQEYALDFYRKQGYELIGRPRYLDAGIWHHDMRKRLSEVGQ